MRQHSKWVPELSSLVLMIALMITAFLCGMAAQRTPKTLWAGDSIVSLAPMNGIKHSAYGCTVKYLTQHADVTQWPNTRYDRIIIMAGTADMMRGTPIETVRADIQELADTLYKMHGVKPIIIDPAVIHQFADTPDGFHLTAPAYANLMQYAGIASS